MADRALSAPKDGIYEPGERVIAVGRPFAWWVALVGVELVLLIGAAVLAAHSQQQLAMIGLAAVVVVFILMAVRYLQWTNRAWVLTDRRVIARAC